MRSASAWAAASFLPLRSARAAPTQSASPPAAAVQEALNLADFETLARQRLQHMVYEFIASGGADEITLRWNREALDQIRLQPRVLVDVSKLRDSGDSVRPGAAIPDPLGADRLSSFDPSRRRAGHGQGGGRRRRRLRGE